MTVGRILGNDKDMGSAFALATPNSGSTRVVLTANHVVGKHEAASLQFVTQAGRRIPVERVERDDDLDVAVLHLSEDVVEGLAVGRAVEGGSWQVESQPRDNDPKLTGTISATRRRFVTQSGHEIYVLQLQVDQILNDYKGYSGSPVVLKLPTEAVIGVLIEQLRSRLSVPTGQPKPATNVLYAIPIQDVLDRFDLPYVPYVLPDSPSSPPFILPQHDIPFFTGREQELKQLETLLLNTQAQGPRVAAIAGLIGTGGMGKSALACHFATLYRHEFRAGVIGLRVDGAQVDALAQRFADLSSVKIDPERGLSAAEIMQSVFQKRQALLIFDNADAAAMQKLHPGGNTCAVIVTTRNRALLRSFGIPTEAQIEVKRFSLEETRKLLCQLLGKQRVAAEPDAVKTFHELVGGLPLALRIVGGLLQDQQSISLVKNAEALRNEKERLKRLRDPDDSNLDVRASFELSLKYLEEDQIALFACLGACAPEGFSLQTAQVVSEQDEVTVSSNLGRLYRLSLINEGTKPGRYVLHPLLLLFSSELAQERKLLVGAEQRHTEYFVAYAERHSDQSPASMNALAKELGGLLLTAERLVDEVQRAVAFYLILEPLLQRRGYWSQALELLETLLQVGRKQQVSLEVAHALLQKGQFLTLLMKYSEAEQVLLEGKEMTLQVEDEYQQRRLEGMFWNSLGNVYQAQGRLTEAEEMLQRSLALWEDLGDTRGMAMALNTLGSAYQEQGKLTEAEEALQRSLAIGEELQDQRHIGMVLNTLGGVYHTQGRLTKAEEALQRSLAIEKNLGDKRGMAIVLNTLGAFYQKQGKSEQASAYLQESFVIHEELTNMSIGGLTTLLVSVLIALGRREVAQEYCRRALIIAPDDRRVLASQHRVLQRIEDEEALRENLKIREKQRDRRQIGVLLNKLGRIYRKQRRLTEAEEALQRSLAIGEELQDQRHIGMVLNTLGGVYQAQGRLTEAKEVLRWALVICEQQVGLEQSYVRMIRENYGALLEHLAGSTEEPDHIAEERSS